MSSGTMFLGYFQDYSSSWPNAGGMQMSDNPMDVIEASIRPAFTSYPRDAYPGVASASQQNQAGNSVYLAAERRLEWPSDRFEIR